MATSETGVDHFLTVNPTAPLDPNEVVVVCRNSLNLAEDTNFFLLVF